MSDNADQNMKSATEDARSHHCFSLSALRMSGQAVPELDRHPMPGSHPGLRVDCSALSAQNALDLANCLPFLACGEESAVHAFSHSLLKDISPENAAQMQMIAEDELRHATCLERLRCELPAPDIHLPVDAMSRFFRRLLTKDSARHFALVAALDLSVCRLLVPLLHPQAGLKQALQVREMLGMIVRDEARHVKVARNMAFRLGLSPLALADIEQEIAHQLAALLTPIRASLERLTHQGPPGGIDVAAAPQPMRMPAMAHSNG